MVQDQKPPLPQAFTPTATEVEPSPVEIATIREKVTQAKIKAFPIDGVGTFTLRRPKGADTIAIGVEFTKILGGAFNMDGVASTLARAVATLKVTAIQQPAGWDWEDSEEVDGYFPFWEEYQSWLASFRAA